MMRLIYVISCIIILVQSAFAADVYTVIANPGENASRSVRLNWHSDVDDSDTYCYYTEIGDKSWKSARRATPERNLCVAYDSMYSKTPDRVDIYERVKFIRNTVELSSLSPATRYKYRIGHYAGDGETRYFETAPESGGWTVAVISDFHAYTPLPKRVDAAMNMLDTLEVINAGEFDAVLHVGDIIAWGGSYSFWRDLYTRPHFKKYMWAGLNGNHDNMDRTNKRNSNSFFRNANNNPLNGYEGEIGVCYHFTYGNTLFVMLNNESMRSEEGLKAAQQWVRKVIAENKAKFVVVMEHYQWFFGNDGKTSQYGRWCNLFDECGVDLAISANNHIYARTNALYQGKETDGTRGTVYLQTPSSDNERGQAMKEWTDNLDVIKYRWSEGPNTVGAIIMKNTGDMLQLTLYDRFGTAIDSVSVMSKR